MSQLMFTLKNTCSYIQQAKKGDRSRQRVAWGVRGIFDLDQLLTFTRTCVLEAFSQRIGMLISTKYAAIRNSTILENVLSKLETVLSVHRTLLHRVFPTCCQSRLQRCSLSQRVTEKFVCGMIGIHKILTLYLESTVSRKEKKEQQKSG